MALSGLVMQFMTHFASVALQYSEDEISREYHTVTGTTGVFNSPHGQSFSLSCNALSLKML